MAVTGVAGCAEAGPVAPDGRPQNGALSSASESRTLALLTRQETPSVSGTALVPGDFTTGSQRRPFNAWLTYSDATAMPVPYLAESLPELNTDNWRVFADGRMETAYRLKPNLSWHDGTPLSADDFVSAWSVSASPDFGVANARPHVAMEMVQAPDPSTVAITWNQAYPDAGALNTNWTPLPRHILEAALPQGRNLEPPLLDERVHRVGPLPPRSVGAWILWSPISCRRCRCSSTLPPGPGRPACGASASRRQLPSPPGTFMSRN